MRARSFLLATGLLALGCRERPAPTPLPAAPTPSARSSSPPAKVPAQGPPAASAAPSVHEQAAYALLEGGEAWSGLAEHATEPGVDFDPELPRRLGPLVPKEPVEPVAPTVRGRLSPEVIQRILRQHLDGLGSCFESGLRNHPDLQARVTLHFVIAPDGTARAKSDADLPASFIRCMDQVFRRMRFPAPEGGPVTVQYPLNFARGE